MGTTVFAGNTPGGRMAAEAMAAIIDARDKLNTLHATAVQVGNMTDPFAGANFESGSGIFEVTAGKGQEFFDKVGNIKTALDTFWSGQGETVFSLYQGS